MMLRLTLTDGDTLHVDPLAVDYVRELVTERSMDGEGDRVALVGVGGEEFAVEDPGRTVAREVNQARRRWAEACGG